MQVDSHTRAQILAHLGVENSATNDEQLGVLLECFGIFIERNERRKDLWARFGWPDSLMHIRSKAERLALLLDGSDQKPQDMEDEALDLVNYSIFFVRNSRNGD